ncbi:MAG TPA: hypothetical protein VF515_10020 [Candidatus Binatia bacterium]
MIIPRADGFRRYRGDGGGINNSGTLTIRNSTVSGNTTASGGFGDVAIAEQGGGVDRRAAPFAECC